MAFYGDRTHTENEFIMLSVPSIQDAEETT